MLRACLFSSTRDTTIVNISGALQVGNRSAYPGMPYGRRRPWISVDVDPDSGPDAFHSNDDTPVRQAVACGSLGEFYA